MALPHAGGAVPIDGENRLLDLAGSGGCAYLEGDSGCDGWYQQHTDKGLESAALLLRRIHGASRD